MKSQREREGKRAYESKDGARGRGEKKMRERKEREEWKGGTEGQREESHCWNVEKPITTRAQLRPVFHT